MASTPGKTTVRRAAAATIISVQSDMVARGSHLASAALAGAREFVEWGHYPHRDCVDAGHLTEFYYHAHQAAKRAPGEHGHFHVFARHADGRFWHLVGISLDNLGRATRLFATNRWVTGESWAPAVEMLPRLETFALTARGRMAPVARWIEAMVRFYQSSIVDLMQERDAWLAARGPGKDNVLDDRSIHIVNERAIDVLADVAGAVAPVTD